MADDLKNRREADRSRISLNEEREVRHWTEELRVRENMLRNVIAQVGNSAAAVRKHLNSRA